MKGPATVRKADGSRGNIQVAAGRGDFRRGVGRTWRSCFGRRQHGKTPDHRRRAEIAQRKFREEPVDDSSFMADNRGNTP